jgi:hypothetical protein
MFFWILAPCILVGRCQRFGETYCLHLQGWNGNAGKWKDLCREWTSQRRFAEMLASTYESTRTCVSVPEPPTTAPVTPRSPPFIR